MNQNKKFQLFFLNNISWVLIIIFYAFFAITRPAAMLQLSTISYMIYSTVPLGFIVIGVSLCLLVGELDLSLAQMTGFVAMLSALIVTRWLPGIPLGLSILVPIVVGVFAGAINGFLVGFFNLNSFLVTLGAFMAYEGGTLLLRSHPIFSGFSDFYLLWGRNDSVSILMFVVIILIMAFVLKFTSFGLHIYGVGGNEKSAGMLGVSPGKVKFFTFSLAGGFAGLAALFYTGFLSSVPPGLADGQIFMAFAGAIIGGVELQGGRGSIINVLAGIIFLSLVGAGLSMFNVNPFLRRVIYGLLVLLAIFVNKARNILRDRLLQATC